MPSICLSCTSTFASYIYEVSLHLPKSLRLASRSLYCVGYEALGGDLPCKQTRHSSQRLSASRGAGSCSFAIVAIVREEVRFLLHTGVLWRLQGGLCSSSSFIVGCSLTGDFSFEVVLSLFACLSFDCPSSACIVAKGSDGVDGERDLDERFDVVCTSG